MGGARVIVTLEGLDEVLGNLTAINEKAQDSLIKQVQMLARDTEQFWKQVTPRRTGRLQAGDRAEGSGLSFTLNNSVRYYPFVDTGHWTPRGWRTRHGYRLAKRRSHVEGREMTSKTVDFITRNILEYLSKFLDNA